ncbi:DNA primase [Candidatus Babeliales bacterium]|nr:DNA primase [Candidatus Babeliales bacterium]
MDLFNFIKNNVDILSTVGEYTLLKKTGSLYWKGRCPFHHEKTASFTVSPHKNIFYCFGCHATGDVISFVEKIENLSPYEATQHLVQKYHLQVPKELLQSSGNHPTPKTYYQLCHSVATWCNQMLYKNPTALQYLTQRNIQTPTITHFMLGFFPAGSRNIQQLIAHITMQGHNTQDLIDAHILMQGKQGLYAAYENRIMFPIKDHLGNICGFGGRVFSPEDTRPKYYNSMESSYFKKGKILFGFDSAKQVIQKNHIAIIVEGYMDSIALWQYGLKHAVATLGTACTIDHLQQLAKHAQTIYLLYDADNAGQQAIIRVATTCWQLDLDVKVVLLPKGQDPASLLEKQEDIMPYIDQAKDIFNFFIEVKTNSFAQDSMKHKMSTLNELFEVIAQVPDTLKQNVLLMKAAESLQMSLEILKNEYTKRYSPEPKIVPQATKQLDQQTNVCKLEEQIIACIAYAPYLLTESNELLLTTGLSQQAQQIVQDIMQHVKSHAEPCNHSVEEMINAQSATYVRTLMFTLQIDSITQAFSNLMVQFQKKYWKTITSTIKMKIMQAKRNHNDQEVQRLLTVFEQLKSELYKNGRL